MTDLVKLLLEQAQTAHAKAMENMIWGTSSSGGWTAQTSTPTIKWPSSPPSYLYIEVATIHPAPGETGIYTLSEAHFPGARVWLGPPRHLLSPAVYQAVQDACPDILPLDADPEVRWRLLNHYWPAMPAATPPSSKLAGHLWGDRIP